jgi:cytochrome c oxidase subunit 3
MLATESPPRARAETDAYIGMIVFLGAWVMTFAALFFAYGVLRAQAVSWPPPTERRLPRGLPGLNTLVLIASSLWLRRGLAAARRASDDSDGDRDRQSATSGHALLGAMALGAIFLTAQIGIWRAMMARGLAPASGIYGSVFFALTGFHALHVLCGLVALAVIGLGRARDRPARARALRVTALFWDFVTVIWVLMYLAIYVL